MKDATIPQTPKLTVWLCGNLLLTAAIGFLIFWMIFSGSDLSTAVRLIFLAVFVLTLKRWTGAILFAFCQLQLLFLERSSRSPEVSPDGWLWGALSIGLLILLSRYRTLQDREDKPAHKTIYQFFKQPTRHRVSAGTRRELNLMMGQLVRLACMLALCAIAAWTILGAFPTRSTATGLNTVREYGLKPEGYRLLVVSLSLFAGFFAIWLVVNEFTWRRLSGRQAKIYLNSVLLKFMHRDFGIVTRKRRKLNRKQIKPRLQPGDSNKQTEV